LRSTGCEGTASPLPRWEAPGVYWTAPFEALEEAGIRADLLHAQHVKQIRGRKTDTDDSTTGKSS